MDRLGEGETQLAIIGCLVSVERPLRLKEINERITRGLRRWHYKQGRITTTVNFKPRGLEKHLSKLSSQGLVFIDKTVPRYYRTYGLPQDWRTEAYCERLDAFFGITANDKMFYRYYNFVKLPPGSQRYLNRKRIVSRKSLKTSRVNSNTLIRNTWFSLFSNVSFSGKVIQQNRNILKFFLQGEGRNLLTRQQRVPYQYFYDYLTTEDPIFKTHREANTAMLHNLIAAAKRAPKPQQRTP